MICDCSPVAAFSMLMIKPSRPSMTSYYKLPFEEVPCVVGKPFRF